ncbi:PATL6 [Linum grandiflorum]
MPRARVCEWKSFAASSPHARVRLIHAPPCSTLAGFLFAYLSLFSSDSSSRRPILCLLRFLRLRPDKNGSDLISKESWIIEFGADSVVEEDLGFKELEGVVAYMQGFDWEGHPVCYNAYGVFKDKELYEKVFGDDEKLKNFLRWRVLVLERGINLLHFKPNGVNSIIQVTDMKDMPKKELRVASNHILSLFQDNYPEMVARKIFINVSWYFSVLYSMFSPFLTQRTKSKFVISKEGNVAETLKSVQILTPQDKKHPLGFGLVATLGSKQSRFLFGAQTKSENSSSLNLVKGCSNFIDTSIRDLSIKIS